MPDKQKFDSLIDGKQVSLFKLKNKRNTELYITNYGCRIVSLSVYDKNEQPVDVVIGFDTLFGYLTTTEVYYGATIGRYANRIAKGRFNLNNTEYQLAINNAPNHLHGGPGGLHAKVWNVEEAKDASILLSYLSPDGEEGYPGNLIIKVGFTLSDENELIIHYEARTDKPTILNLTNHAYFNLNGQGSGTILRHQLQLNAGHFTPVDASLIPTGILQPVAQTPFDFTTPHAIGERINHDNVQLQYGNGYDHNYVRSNSEQSPGYTARVVGDMTGIAMEVFTTEPSVQFYTGNFMPGENITSGHVPDDFRTAFCLETQHYPDSPNHSNFPSTVLNPEEVFTSTTVYKFSVES